MQQSTIKIGMSRPVPSKQDDPWGFKMEEGRSFVGSGEDVPFDLQLKPFNSEVENVYSR